MVCEKIISDETGALTIEWVVLTAGVILSLRILRQNRQLVI